MRTSIFVILAASLPCACSSTPIARIDDDAGAVTTDASPVAVDSATDSGAAPAFAPGVFALLASNEQSPDPSLYTNPAIAGIAVRTAWESCEPGNGVFDWKYLDAQIAAAKTAGKKVSIAVAAVSAKHPAPAWLSAAGAKLVTIKDPSGDTYPIPVPWDEIFLDAYTAFVSAFGARYANEPTVAFVRGATESVTNGWGLPGTDSSGVPLSSYGYSPDKEVAALERVVDAFMTAFPRTLQWEEVGFVKDTENLGVDAGYFAQAIADYGFTKYPDRFEVWREDLSDCTPNPPTRADWTILAAHPGHDGAQMVWNVQDGPQAFRMDGCTNAPPDKGTVLRDAIQKGIDFGMPYLEIYEADCKDTDPAMVAALQLAAQQLPAQVK